MVERLIRQLTADEERRVAEYMSSLASSTIAAAPAPQAASAIWVKAQLLSRWDAERKAMRPLDAIEPVQIGLGLVAAAVLLMWSAPALMSSLAFLRP
jgi:hypothetical protein